MARSPRRPKKSDELKRRPAFRREPDRVLIVTEGSKTEPSYFRKLVAEYGLTTAKVTIVGDGGSAPISVVKDAQKQLKQDDDFEQVYCVFDRDRHESYDDAIEAVQRLAATSKLRKKVIAAITSVPCFEVWYLLHVSSSRKPYEAAVTGGSPAASLIDDLKKQPAFNQYDKKSCDDFYSAITAKRDDAIKRAEKFLEDAKLDGESEFHENPSTRVHFVVLALADVARKK